MFDKSHCLNKKKTHNFYIELLSTFFIPEEVLNNSNKREIKFLDKKIKTLKNNFFSVRPSFWRYSGRHLVGPGII